MEIYYRILSVDPKEHSMVVRYWTDTLSEFQLAIEFNKTGGPMLAPGGYPTRCRTDYNLTLYETPSPSSEEELKLFIMNNAPIQWFILHEDIRSNSIDTSMAIVSELVTKKQSFTIDVPPKHGLSN